MKLIHNFLVTSLLILSLGHTSQALADGPNLQLFHPTVDGSGVYTLYDSETLKARDWSLGLTLHHARELLQLNQQAVSDGLLTLDASLMIGLHDRFSLGINVPIAVHQQVNSAYAGQISESGVHDFGIVSKIQLLDHTRHALGLALIARAFVPTGDAVSYLGDAGGAYGALVALDRKWSRFHLVFNVGGQVRPVENIFNNLRVSHQFDFGLGARFVLMPDFLILKAEIAGATQFDRFFTESITTPIQAHGGFEFLLKQGLKFDVAGGASVVDAYGAPAWRVLVGLRYSPALRQGLAISKLLAEPEIAVHFNYNEARLTPDAETLLAEVLQSLKIYKKSKVQIVGYADSVGAYNANERLGQARSLAVKNFLNQQGIDEARLEILKPQVILVTGATISAEREKQRKVVVTIVPES